LPAVGSKIGRNARNPTFAAFDGACILGVQGRRKPALCDDLESDGLSFRRAQPRDLGFQFSQLTVGKLSVLFVQ
jgi:hypothetical protein